MAKDKPQKEMTFFQHLEELRWNIVRSVIAILLVAIIVFIFKDFVFGKVIMMPTRPDFATYQALCGLSEQLGLGDRLCVGASPLPVFNTEMIGQFMTHIKVSFTLGFVLASPYVFWEVWRFVKPALRKNELKHSRGIVLICTFLLIVGVLFAYFVVVPFAVTFLGNYQVIEEVRNEIRLSSYIQFISMVCLAGGIIFQMPIAAWLLSKIGLLTPNFMRKYRKHSIVAIVILSAIITPPDVASQLIMAIPIWGLYEISIGISKRVNKKFEEAEEAT